MSPEEEALVESACTAWRPRATDGRVRFHPAWHDLDAGGRREVFERTVQLRALEQALDSDGMSTTARAVLARIRR
jgi:hypothetical protein